MEQSQDITELAIALAQFQAEMAPVEKSSNNPFFKSKYADLATVMKDAMPLTSKNGLSIVQFPGIVNDIEVLYTQVSHKSGQWMRSCMKLHLTKNDAQGQGSALTYAKRYAAMAALGIVADEDDDGNAASKKQPAKPAVSTDLAANWQINNIKIVARRVSGIKDEVELTNWVEDTLGWPLDKLPKQKVQAAIEKLEAKAQTP